MNCHNRDNNDLSPLIRRAMTNAESAVAGCPEAFLLARYIEKNLPPDEETQIERHLVACQACRQAVIAVVEAETAFRDQSTAISSGQADMESLLQAMESRCGMTRSTRPAKAVPHVMIVDDDQNYLHALEDILSQDYRVTACCNGREALGHLADHPRVIVLDIKMPEMDGFEVARRINSIKNAPAIIFNTGYPGQFHSKDILEEYDFFDYVTKDKPALLLNAIKRSCAEITGSPD